MRICIPLNSNIDCHFNTSICLYKYYHFAIECVTQNMIKSDIKLYDTICCFVCSTGNSASFFSLLRSILLAFANKFNSFIPFLFCYCCYCSSLAINMACCSHQKALGNVIQAVKILVYASPTVQNVWDVNITSLHQLILFFSVTACEERTNTHAKHMQIDAA